MKSKKCVENLYFWVDVELFKNHVYTPDSELADSARRIYDQYICDRSTSMVNLDIEVVER
jgi:hypothetical protein